MNQINTFFASLIQAAVETKLNAITVKGLLLVSRNANKCCDSPLHNPTSPPYLVFATKQEHLLLATISDRNAALILCSTDAPSKIFVQWIIVLLYI